MVVLLIGVDLTAFSVTLRNAGARASTRYSGMPVSRPVHSASHMGQDHTGRPLDPYVDMIA